jgi:hypothetical protein
MTVAVGVAIVSLGLLYQCISSRCGSKHLSDFAIPLDESGALFGIEKVRSWGENVGVGRSTSAGALEMCG